MGSILKCIQLINNIPRKKMLKFLLYLALTSTVVFCSQNRASNCPDDEEWIDFTFFNLGCLYIGESRPMTWSIAKAFCYGKSHSQFIEVYDEQELDALRAIAEVLNTTNHYYWLGATDAHDRALGCGIKPKVQWDLSYGN